MCCSIGAGKEERIECVFPQQDYKHYGGKKSIAVKVLHDEWKRALPSVLLIPHAAERCRLLYSAAERIRKVRSIEHLTVIVAAQAEAKRERENDKRRRYREVTDVNSELNRRRVEGRQVVRSARYRTAQR